jgi:hypothetical protein
MGPKNGKVMSQAFGSSAARAVVGGGHTLADLDRQGTDVSLGVAKKPDDLRPNGCREHDRRSPT